MLWYFLLIAIIVGMLLELYSIISGKPTRKSALKICVNRWAYLILGFGSLFSATMVLILAVAGNSILAKSTDINVLIISSGIGVTLEIIMASFILVVVLDVLNAYVRKKKLQVISIYFNWAEKLDKEGLFKYTDAEKEYNKKQDDEFKAKMHKIFPILNRKKESKDGTL